MKCVVIDDEPLAREGMALLIKEIPELSLVGSFANALEADRFLSSNEADLIFIDMEMPKISGIEYLRNFKPKSKVIITTAYRDFAVEGFEVGAVDYLLKPIRFERFYQAVSKLMNENKSENVADLSTPSNGVDHLFIRTERKFVRVPVNQIIYLEGLKDYVVIHCLHDKYSVATNLKSVLQQLPPQVFIRINKSFAVNCQNISSIDNHFVTLGEQQIPIGELYRSSITEYLKSNRLIRRES